MDDTAATPHERSGVLVIDKPADLTSHDVVVEIRRKLGIRKAGHLGTLDPMATGVLPICVGKATRLSQFLAGSAKEYFGEIRLGFSTDTYDREGRPTSREEPAPDDRAAVEAAMASFVGTLDQLPPGFSAKKVGGVEAYKLARKGRPAALKPVQVTVGAFRLTRWAPPALEFQVACSAGTYIRSLAHDLGQRLGCGAHLTSLRRTRSGEFHLEQARLIDLAGWTDVIPLERLREDLPRIEVPAEEEHRVGHGIPVGAMVEGPLARIFNKRGELIAVAAVNNGWAAPRVVLISPT